MTSGKVLGATSATAATATVMTLPNTGSNAVVTVAVSVLAGMVVWGVLYARSRA